MADHKATGLLTAKTHWLDYCAKVMDHLAYLAVASNTSGPPPKDLFEDVAEEMKKQYQEDKANIKDALKAGKFTVTSAWTLDKFKAFIGGVYDLVAVSKTNLELVFEEVIEQAKEKEEKEAKKRQMLADNFMNLLYSVKEIVASSKWEDCVPLLKDAQVYRAISDESFRREIFDEYVKHLQEKVKEKEHKQDEEKLVFEEVIEQTRKKEEKEAKKRKRLADDFMDFLYSEKEIVASSKWKDCIPLLEDAQEYRYLMSTLHIFKKRLSKRNANAMTKRMPPSRSQSKLGYKLQCLLISNMHKLLPYKVLSNSYRDRLHSYRPRLLLSL